MKQHSLLAVLCLMTLPFLAPIVSAQTPWYLSGNTGAAGQWLGTNNGFPIIFRSNNTEHMRVPFVALMPTANMLDRSRSSVIIGGAANGAYDGDPNRDRILLKLDVQAPVANTDGASIAGRFAATSNGTKSVGSTSAQFATCTNWSAGGSIVGVQGVGTFSKISATSGSASGVGGAFGVTLSAATLSGTATVPINVFGVSGALGGTVTTYQTNGVNAAVYGTDGINSTKTFAGYFAGKVYLTSSLWVGSDMRFKTNIQPIASPLDRLAKVRGVTYGYDRAKFADRNFAEGITDGYLAQEVREVFPELVHEANDGYLSVNYIGMVPVLTEAVKQLRTEKDTEIAGLQQELAAKQTQLEALEARLAKLEALVMQRDDRTQPSTGAVAPRLLGNQPNPFGGVTTINFELPESVRSAELRVTDLQGRTVRQVNIDQRGAGSLQIDLHDVPSGTFIGTLVADGQPAGTVKLVRSER